jgi:hypothetical protein
VSKPHLQGSLLSHEATVSAQVHNGRPRPQDWLNTNSGQTYISSSIYPHNLAYIFCAQPSFFNPKIYLESILRSSVRTPALSKFTTPRVTLCVRKTKIFSSTYFEIRASLLQRWCCRGNFEVVWLAPEFTVQNTRAHTHLQFV